MSAQVLAAIILTPFVIAFVYAGYHEFRRYKADGKASYGLVFDEETGTTHVTGIPEGEEAYDVETFDPSDYNDPEIASASDEPSEQDGETETETEQERDEART
ncbi:hypothetical protein [Pseudooceanicola sp. MF1-13]|uniref:hypothetical protein n=1 Tax=Pseudooceanicola sp. MF1-13 TaxID=3379095 RepID=UPI0038926334